MATFTIFFFNGGLANFVWNPFVKNIHREYTSVKLESKYMQMFILKNVFWSAIYIE